MAPLQRRVLSDVIAQTWVRNLVRVAGGAVFAGLAAQIAIGLPFTPVLITWRTFAVPTTGAARSPRRGSERVS